MVTPEWAVALATQAWPTNTNVCYVLVRCENKKTGSKGPRRDEARERIVQGALDLKAPYVWFIDDDVEVPFGACRQLMKTLSEAPDDVMAVAGIYPAKRLPIEPIVYKTNGHGPFTRWKKDTIFECSLIGTGCMLIKTEAFGKIDKPWFKDVDTDTLQITDDGWFCGKLELAGLKVLADAHVLCTHWDGEIPYRFTEDTYPMLPAGKEHILRDIPPGWMSIPELAWLSDQAAQRQRIVEIGSYLGRSTVVMGRSTSGEVWAIDDFRGVRDTNFSNTNNVPLLPDTFPEFQKNVSQLANVKWIRADHSDFSALPAEWVRGSDSEKPDMVFIDGSHKYDDVKRDILAWKQRLAPRGLLCGHDADWPGVQQAVAELLPQAQVVAGTIWSCP